SLHLSLIVDATDRGSNTEIRQLLRIVLAFMPVDQLAMSFEVIILRVK
ncbi:MAG: hypothetical protein EZS28_039129, partial [Streblomastix strix]